MVGTDKIPEKCFEVATRESPPYTPTPKKISTPKIFVPGMVRSRSVHKKALHGLLRHVHGSMKG
jgi:hypothetical protein